MHVVQDLLCQLWVPRQDNVNLRTPAEVSLTKCFIDSEEEKLSQKHAATTVCMHAARAWRSSIFAVGTLNKGKV